jgi:hypothetical protein
MNIMPHDQRYAIATALVMSIRETWKYRHLPINRSLLKQFVQTLRWHYKNSY